MISKLSLPKKTRIFLLISTIIGLVLLWLNIFWLFSFGVAILLTKYLLSRLRLHSYLAFLITCLLTLGCVIIFRLLIADLYIVPSDSMENAIFPGNRLMVNKLIYGPKLPRGLADIPWLNNVQDLSREWHYRRLSGISSICRNDIVVFKKTKNDEGYLVKRCVGLPGEEIKIYYDSIFVDGRFIIQPATVKNSYSFIPDKGSDFFLYASKNGISTYSNKDGTLGANLTRTQKEYVQKTALLGQVNYLPTGWRFFCDMQKELREKTLKKWIGDNFGPVMIPKKGLLITINSRNLYLYYQAILSEAKDVKLINKILYSKGVVLNKYKFLNNYYFFMGDNRHFSYDSRYWGFTSEEQIEGKVVLSIPF